MLPAFFFVNSLWDIIMADKAEEQCKCAGGTMKQGQCVLPKITFSAFIMSLNTSALFYLGEIPDPETGKKSQDLMLVHHTIDTLDMLKEKTVGNLRKEDATMLVDFISDLKMRYVKACG